MIEQLELETPGIYNQGLITLNADGSIRRQTTLPDAITRQVITFGEERGLTMGVYRGNDILVRKRNHNSQSAGRIRRTGRESAVGPLQNILIGGPVNKVFAIHRADARDIKALRWHLNTQLGGSCHLVQPGLPIMLEILPRGASKGTALKALMDDMKITADKVLAMGDGDNDIEMIQQAGIGIAVANASQGLKDAADHIVSSNEDDGVAEVINRFVLKTESPVEDRT